jgi:hypothetical protein
MMERIPEGNEKGRIRDCVEKRQESKTIREREGNGKRTIKKGWCRKKKKKKRGRGRGGP